jgi:glycosyltransferase involved in cell wall biosynthesis
MRPIRVLHVARNFPSVVLPRLGLWTERFVRSAQGPCEATVIAPVPYWPPIPGPADFTRYRLVPARAERHGVEIHHPRFVTGPGSWFSDFEGITFGAAVKHAADPLHAARPFDVVHAHFVHPEGFASARLAQRWGVPLVITEHASWEPWLDNAPRVRKRAIEAAARSRFVHAVSRALARTISRYVDLGDRLRVIPNIVDDEIFTLPPADMQPLPDRILFVGLIRRVKGLDVLVNAMRILVDRGVDVRLDIVGESVYGSYQRYLETVRRQVATLGLERHVAFLGGMQPPEVANEIWRSALLVVPSRRETFAAVLAEALACGRPVVATRCGGPEDFVVPEVGELVDVEDPAALADGIARVLSRRQSYDPAALRAYAVERFGMAAVGARLTDLYREAVGARGDPRD